MLGRAVGPAGQRILPDTAGPACTSNQAYGVRRSPRIPARVMRALARTRNTAATSSHPARMPPTGREQPEQDRQGELHGGDERGAQRGGDAIAIGRRLLSRRYFWAVVVGHALERLPGGVADAFPRPTKSQRSNPIAVSAADLPGRRRQRWSSVAAYISCVIRLVSKPVPWARLCDQTSLEFTPCPIGGRTSGCVPAGVDGGPSFAILPR
jgi:hypothetical protein